MMVRSKARLGLVLLVILVIGIPALIPLSFAQADEKVRVIIGFKGVNDIELVRAHGGSLKYAYKYIKAIVASLPAYAIEALSGNPNIAYVEEDFQVQTLTQTTPWGVSKINAPQVWSTVNTGLGVKVAVLDTGIDTSHTDLSITGGATFVAGTSSYNDDNGHGTHCAGIITALNNANGVVGVAPGVSLYAVKVLNSAGSGYISDIVNGIEWCISNGIQVISMSFGSSSDSSSLRTECEKAYNAGVVLVAAAGNSGPNDNTVTYPGKYSTVISVSATDSSDTIASFSSRGSEVSVSAPGVSIYSTYKGNTYAYMSGTSMACPHVAGAAALVLAKYPGSKPADVKNIIQSTSVDLGVSCRDNLYGYGRVDAYAATTPTSTPPSEPQNLKAVAGNSQVTLTWSQPATGGPSLTYNLYRAEVSGQETQYKSNLGNVLTFTDTGVTNSVTYYYQITADNKIGESVRSNEVSATPTVKTLSVTVKTDKATYSINSRVTITVTVTDGTNPVLGATVKVTVKPPSGSSWTATCREVGNGQYTTTYRIGRIKGTYTVTATATKTRYVSGTGSTTFKV